MAKPLSKAGATRVSKVLEALYIAKSRFLTFYRPTEANVIDDGYLNMTTVNAVSAWIADMNNLPINDIKNKDALIEAQGVPASEVIAKMKKFETIDEEL